MSQAFDIIFAGGSLFLMLANALLIQLSDFEVERPRVLSQAD